MAEWLGVGTDYIVGELQDGRMHFENVSRGTGRRCYRVRLSDFVAYLKARGYQRFPTAQDFRPHC